MKPGDQVVAVDRNSTAGRSLTEVVNGIRGTQGTRVVLSVVRGGQPPVDIQITRAAVDAPRVEVVGPNYLLGQIGNDGRLALPALLIGRLKPVPAFQLIGRGCLLGIGDEEPFPFGQDIHASTGGEIVGGLRTAMEHDDQPYGLPCVAAGNVELVATSPSMVRIGAVGELSSRPNIAPCPVRSTIR